MAKDVMSNLFYNPRGGKSASPSGPSNRTPLPAARNTGGMSFNPAIPKQPSTPKQIVTASVTAKPTKMQDRVPVSKPAKMQDRVPTSKLTAQPKKETAYQRVQRTSKDKYGSNL